MTDGDRTAEQYNAMAESYAAEAEGNIFNALYERPATIALLGDVSGLRVLEVGCGAGALTEWLVDQGARVTAMDVSRRMLDLAGRRVGGRATLITASVDAPLHFQPDNSVDLVVASLVLHYVQNWESALGEFRRVLVPGGCVVFSTHHPTMDWRLHSADDYFAVKQVTETWIKQGVSFDVTFWRRPLTAMTAAIASAGFLIERLVEPGPAAEAADRDADTAHLLRTEPRFLFFRLRAAGQWSGD